MSKQKHNRKGQEPQEHKRKELPEPQPALHESVPRERQPDPSQNPNYQRQPEKEQPMGFLEFARRPSITDWCIAAFTLLLTIAAIYQYAILNGQLDVMRKDQRAWVSVTGNRNATFDPVTLHAPLLITNTGKTPAIDVRSEFYVEVVPNGSEPHFEGAIPHFTWSVGVINPNEPKPITPFRIRARVAHPAEVEDYPVTAEEKVALDEGRAWLAVHGRVRYNDVFKKRHWITYCSWNFFKPDAQYSSKSCTEYNGVDDD